MNAPNAAPPSFNGFVPDHVRELLDAGADEKALAYIKQFAGEGNTRAMLAMADYEYDKGNQEASLSWVSAVEASAAAGDHEACIYLASAYQRGLGQGSPEERRQSSLRMLEQAAENGYLSCAHALMSNYLHGLNGAPVSKERFAYWAGKAASFGSIAASAALSKLDEWPNIVPRKK